MFEVMAFFKDDHKLQFRQICTIFAKKIVPNSINKLEITCPCADDPDAEPKTYKLQDSIYKLLLKDISGDDQCSAFIEEMGTKFGPSAQFLELEFYGDFTGDNAAKQFVSGLKKFEKVNTLKISVNSEGNSSKIFNELNKETA